MYAFASIGFQHPGPENAPGAVRRHIWQLHLAMCQAEIFSRVCLVLAEEHVLCPDHHLSINLQLVLWNEFIRNYIIKYFCSRFGIRYDYNFKIQVKPKSEKLAEFRLGEVCALLFMYPE